MAEAGESFKSIVNIMGAIPKSLTITPTLAPPINTDCCFERLVFGALTGTDPFENDHTRFINRYPNGVSYSYIEFYLSWQAVLLAHGAGVYRIKTIEANILASLPDQNQFSDQYVLKVFSPEAADGTVRLDTVTSAKETELKDSRSLLILKIHAVCLDGLVLMKVNTNLHTLDITTV